MVGEEEEADDRCLELERRIQALIIENGSLKDQLESAEHTCLHLEQRLTDTECENKRLKDSLSKEESRWLKLNTMKPEKKTAEAEWEEERACLMSDSARLK